MPAIRHEIFLSLTLLCLLKKELFAPPGSDIYISPNEIAMNLSFSLLSLRRLFLEFFEEVSSTWKRHFGRHFQLLLGCHSIFRFLIPRQSIPLIWLERPWLVSKTKCSSLALKRLSSFSDDPRPLLTFRVTRYGTQQRCRCPCATIFTLLAFIRPRGGRHSAECQHVDAVSKGVQCHKKVANSALRNR